VSSSIGEQLVLSRDFIEWFRGFTDAEGCFLIIYRDGNTFEFEFSIKLHIDDKAALDYIQSTLGIGKVRLSRTGPNVTFKVNSQREIAIIVAIFTKYKLNSTKYLNFIAFARAFRLYMDNNSLEARKKVMPTIKDIKGDMNKQRVNFNMPPNHYNITSYWLLGFFEGDGSVYFKSDKNALAFAINQKGNKALMYAIKDYLLILASIRPFPHDVQGEKGVLLPEPEGRNESVIKVESKNKGVFTLSVYDNYFIESVITSLSLMILPDIAKSFWITAMEKLYLILLN